MMTRVGITGNIGSGKTTICRIFEILGIPVFHADVAGRELLNDPDVKNQIIRIFSKDIFDHERNIDRKKLASIVFNDTEKLSELNAIIHPAVRDKFEIWLTEHNQKPYVLYEAAILFESGHYKRMDRIISVIAPDEVRLKRVVERDSASETEVKARMSNQVDQAVIISNSDFIINNDEVEMLLPQVLKIHKELNNL